MKKILLITILFTGFIHTKNYSQTWGNVGGTTGFDGQVKCLLADDNANELYAGGTFTNINGTAANKIAKWNGTSWTAMGSGFDGVVWALIKYNGELYAGGSFTMSGSTSLPGIAKWNGTSWVAVGTGVSGGLSTVDAFAVFNNELYVGGWFSSAGGMATTKNIAKWNGSAWSAVAGGIYDGVMALHVYNNELYAGGYFVINNTTFSLQYRICKLSGSSWVNVGTKGLGDANQYWGTRSLTTYNGALHAGGYFGMLDNGTTANHVASWNGTSWSTLAAGSQVGITSTTSTYVVNAVAVYNNMLFVGGNFSAAGGVSSSNIAAWNQSAWSATGTGVNGAVNALAVFKGELIVAGDFTTAGGNAAGRIAKYTIVGAGIDALANNQVQINNYPNPFNDYTMFTVDPSVKLQSAELKLYDITGREVRKISDISENKIKFGKNDMPSGIYIYRLMNNNAAIGTGKLIIE